MSPITEFSTAPPRPLPVFLLLDGSGSMSVNAKVDVLNDAVRRMVARLADQDAGLAEVHLAAIAFSGDKAWLHAPLAAAREFQWADMDAMGLTPVGKALDLVAGIIEDRTQVSSRAYRPTLVLVSDGLPTGDWREALERLNASERASKAHRFALAIGDEADRGMLAEFAGPDGRVFEAHEAEQIRRFFRFVTMSVTARSRSVSPNSVPDVEETDLLALEF
ncbi:MAG TPA: VWA domain-containing protein [Longimicrobium sp.]|jgi:uncharacterized protein YegL